MKFQLNLIQVYLLFFTAFIIRSQDEIFYENTLMPFVAFFRFRKTHIFFIKLIKPRGIEVGK